MANNKREPRITGIITRYHLWYWRMSLFLLLTTLVACGGSPSTPALAVPAATQTPTLVLTPTPQVANEIPDSPTATPSPTASRPVNSPPNSTPTPDSTVRPSSLAFQLPNVADTVERVRPAVVSVVAEFVARDFFGNLQSSFSSGTGVIFHSSGLVLTNSHVVKGATTVIITLDDGTQLEAQIKGADRLSDLAVLQLPEDEYPFIPLGTDVPLRVGEWVIAIGNALALPGDLTVTVGVVSALGRSLDVSQDVTLYDLVQTDAVINPGNSGGPLLTVGGELVGINTAVLRQGATGGRTPVEGIGFAINMETAELVSQQLIDPRLRRVRWAWMGAILGDLIPEIAARVGLPVSEGVVIQGVLTGGPADRAGIQRGDIILSMDDREVTTARELTRLLRQEFQADQEVSVELFREDSTLTLQMVLGERPQ
jgi:S1-C subfamily serine protease